MIYDIFISYKRKSLATANNLYYRLTTRGYSTFFDLEEMRRDNFNVQLLNYIENARMFLSFLKKVRLMLASKVIGGMTGSAKRLHTHSKQKETLFLF